MKRNSRATMSHLAPPRHTINGSNLPVSITRTTANAMFPTPIKTFVHPHHAYKLEYPAHWDAVVEKDGESCGFGPHERDDVGLWISILPMSVDTARLKEDLPKLMEKSLEKTEAANLRKDDSLKDY